MVRDGALQMRREKASKRGRWFWIFVAGVLGFLIGDRHAMTWQPTDLRPPEMSRCRFPEAKSGRDGRAASRIAETADEAIPACDRPGNSSAERSSRCSIREPMVPPDAAAVRRQRQSGQSPKLPQSPRPRTKQPPWHPARVPSRKPAAVQRRKARLRHASRPGFMLNDAQIVSIKQRLHLTADQESMWPAVEAALRNVAYAQTRDARQPGAPRAPHSLPPPIPTAPRFRASNRRLFR